MKLQRLSYFSLHWFPARYSGLITAFFLSIVMTCIVSLISSVRAVGVSPGLLHLWLGVWPVSWCIAFPVLLMVLPGVKRLSALFIRNTN